MNTYQNRKYFITDDESIRKKIRDRSMRYGLCLGEAEEEFVVNLQTSILKNPKSFLFGDSE